MRKDILEGVLFHIMSETKPNYAALAKQYDCDYRTVKRYYEAGVKGEIAQAITPNNRPEKFYQLKGFESMIEDKLALQCSYTSIYYFLKKKGFTGSYDTLRRFCAEKRNTRMKKATVRVETTPGLSAQVDWKENLQLTSRSGEIFTVNIFLYVLGYSRMKYLKLTLDKKQKTLFACLNNAFYHTGGIPQEIWFDNMRTVVDRSKSQFSKTVFNDIVKRQALNQLLVVHFVHKQKEK